MYEQNFYNGGVTQPSRIANYSLQNTNQRIQRSVSNNNVNSNRPDCQVEYELSMPVPMVRHGPYHSLWNLHQW